MTQILGLSLGRVTTSKDFVWIFQKMPLPLARHSLALKEHPAGEWALGWIPAPVTLWEGSVTLLICRHHASPARTKGRLDFGEEALTEKGTRFSLPFLRGKEHSQVQRQVCSSPTVQVPCCLELQQKSPQTQKSNPHHPSPERELLFPKNHLLVSTVGNKGYILLIWVGFTLAHLETVACDPHTHTIGAHTNPLPHSFQIPVQGGNGKRLHKDKED